MGIKKTIAIIGALEKKGIPLTICLSACDYRLLLLSKDSTPIIEFANSIKEVSPNIEIETIDCIIDCCWEADIIFLAIDYKEQKDIIEKIAAVSTQKIVVTIIDKSTDITFSEGALQKLIPYAKVVEVSYDNIPNKYFVNGNDVESIQTIFSILNKANYLTFIRNN